MLFDLRGRRRNAVKVVYLGLAILLGGGLVLFGIGGEVQGGLFDAFKDQADSAREQAVDRRDSAAKKTTANPRDAAAWASLADAEFALSNQSKGISQDPNTGAAVYAGAARRHLEASKRAWDRHVALAGERPNVDLALRMTNVFTGLEDYAGAVAAQELVMEQRGDDAGTGDYSRLATFAYQAGQTRKGDLAAERAIELAPKAQKDQVKQLLDQTKAQAGAQAGQSTTPAPTPPTSTTGS